MRLSKIPERRLWMVASALVVIALAIMVYGCATVQPSPVASEQQKARELAERGIKELDFGVTVIDGIKPIADLLPASRAELKIDIFCTLAKTTGRSANTPAADLAAAEKVCGGPLPLAADAPLVRTGRELAAVGSCASLAATISRARGLVEPLLAKLDASKEATLRFAALSLRSGMAFLLAYQGGATCG